MGVKYGDIKYGDKYDGYGCGYGYTCEYRYGYRCGYGYGCKSLGILM